jgi:hypothetical protein
MLQDMHKNSEVEGAKQSETFAKYMCWSGAADLTASFDAATARFLQFQSDIEAATRQLAKGKSSSARSLAMIRQTLLRWIRPSPLPRWVGDLRSDAGQCPGPPAACSRHTHMAPIRVPLELITLALMDKQVASSQCSRDWRARRSAWQRPLDPVLCGVFHSCRAVHHLLTRSSVGSSTVAGHSTPLDPVLGGASEPPLQGTAVEGRSSHQDSSISSM